MSGIFQQARSFATRPNARFTRSRGVVDSTKSSRPSGRPPLQGTRYVPKTGRKFVVSPTPEAAAAISGRFARGIAYALGVVPGQARTTGPAYDGAGYAEE